MIAILSWLATHVSQWQAGVLLPSWRESGKRNPAQVVLEAGGDGGGYKAEDTKLRRQAAIV